MSSDSDIAHVGRALTEMSQVKRANNRQSSSELLKAKGVSFESKNNGAHLIVDAKIDFWPGTGLFIDRRNNFKNRGIKNLLKQLKRSIK